MTRPERPEALRRSVRAIYPCFGALLLACSGGHSASDGAPRADTPEAGTAGSDDVRTSYGGAAGRSPGSGGTGDHDGGVHGTTGGNGATVMGGARGEGDAGATLAAGRGMDAETGEDASARLDGGNGTDADSGFCPDSGAADANADHDAAADADHVDADHVDANADTDAGGDSEAGSDSDAGADADVAVEADSGIVIDYDDRQWAQLKGPYGGYIWTLYGLEGSSSHGAPAPRALFAGTVGQGLFRSDDSGGTWHRVAGGLPEDKAFRCLHRTASGRLLAGASGTIYLSDDNGVSWSSADVQGIERNYMTIVEVGNRLLVGTDGASILASTDDGQSWVPATSSAPILFALAAKETTLFAATDGFGVQTSTNNGTSWQDDTSEMNGSSVYALEVDADRVYAAAGSRLYVTENDGADWIRIAVPGIASEINTIEVNRSSLLIGTDRDGILRSDDAGQNWVAVNSGLENHSVVSLKVYGSFLYAGTRYGGVFRSSNAGDSWVAANQELTALRVLSIGSGGSSVFAGTEGGYVFRNTNDSESWEQVYFGGNPAADNVWDFAFTTRGIFAGGEGFGVMRSTDDGLHWSSFNNKMNPRDAFSLAQNGDYLFAGTGADVQRSTVTGNDWESLVWGLPTYTYFDAMTVLDGAVFVGTTDEGVYRTDNDGDDWSNVSNEIGTDAVFSLYSYVAEAGTPLLFAGTGNGGVYKSQNGGESWVPSNTGLPVSTVYELTRFGRRLYASTTSGVFESQDDGETWQSYGDELDGLGIAALGASNSYLYAGSLDGTTWRK